MNWAISHLAQRKEFQRITEKGKVFKDRGSHKIKKKKKIIFRQCHLVLGIVDLKKMHNIRVGS